MAVRTLPGLLYFLLVMFCFHVMRWFFSSLFGCPQPQRPHNAQMHRIRLQIPARSPLLLPLARYPRLPAPNRRVYSTLPPLDFPNTLEPPTLPDPPNADLPTSPPHTAFDLPDTSDPTIPNFSDVQLTTWPANSYHIVLLIDFRESTHNKAFISKLLATGIAVEERSLLLGDMVWVARQNEGEEECVLNHIVERKRLDDLAGGILNGRLNEQKVCVPSSPWSLLWASRHGS